MHVGSGDNTYNWVGDWAKVPESESASKGWAPPGIVVTESGDVITCHSSDPTVMTFDNDGKYLSSINGEEGAGRFNCPHGIFIDRHVSDHANARVQVYDMQGNFKRAFGTDFLTTPSGFITYGNFMVIAELKARLAITDIDDKLVTYLGDNEQVSGVEGWPNNKNEEGTVIPKAFLEAGKFNSPHGIAVDADGNIYVAEWLIGGRFTKLAILNKGQGAGI